MSTAFFQVLKGKLTQKLMVRSGWNPNSSRLLSCPGYLQVWWRSNQKWRCYCVHIIFPIISLWGKKIDAKGWVIPKRIFWSGRKSNSSEYLCLSLLPASFTKIRTKMQTLWCPQHFFSSAQGQITPKLIYRWGRNSNSSKILWLSWLPASLIMIQSKMKVLLYSQHFPHDKSMGKIYDVQGQVIPQKIFLFGWKLNLSEILYLSLLPASFTKIRTKMKMLPCPQHFFLCSIA